MATKRTHIGVLIVDDRIVSRNALRAVIETWPALEVLGEAADGREALRLVEVRRPDVVLIDARMPGMDGLEATRRIKGRWPGIKVIMLTMHGSYRMDALAAGVDVFLIKGSPAETLQAAILGSLPRRDKDYSDREDCFQPCECWL